MGKDATFDFACPPPVIRGQDSQKAPSVGLHWFRGSFPLSHWKAVYEFLTRLFGDPEHSDFGLWYYDSCMTWPNGVKVRYHASANRYHLTDDRFALECPGEALAAMDAHLLVYFLKRWDAEFEISVTRQDERFLDREWLITPRRLYALVAEFDLFGNQIKRDYAGIEAIDGRFPSDGTKTIEECVAFGKRGSAGSGSYIRCYNKKLESDGRIDACCWELESSGDKARKRFRDIMDAVASAEANHHDAVAAMVKVIGQHIGGAIDFLQRAEGDKNLPRCPRYEFWTQILQRLGGRLRWAAEKVEKTVTKTKAWIESAVVPGMQMLREALGLDRFYDWFLNDCLDGVDRLRYAHRKAIADYRVGMALVGACTDSHLQAQEAAFRRRNAPAPLTEAEHRLYCR